jgi:UDP-3-O-[3-hydroxymyristoyl] glucosamine N-acyltransferase
VNSKKTVPTKTLGELADYIGGEVKGDPDRSIRGAATLENAGEGDISFIANRKYLPHLSKTKASAVIAGQDIEAPADLIITEDPYYGFCRVIVLLHGHRPHVKCGIAANTAIDKTAAIGKDTHIHDFVAIGRGARVGNECVIYPGVYIGPDTVIGDNCILYPNAVIYDRCILGNDVIIHANATIGEDGYGFATHQGEHHKIPHIGRVILEDNVEIGSGCAIERGALDDTVIGKGCKIGDAVVIGHGTKVGPHCLLVPQVGIAGSTTLGHHCVLAGKAAVGGHIKIGNGVVIGGGSGVANDIPDGQTVFGYIAFEAGKAKRAYMSIKSLPDMRSRIRSLEKRLAELEKK